MFQSRRHGILGAIAHSETTVADAVQRVIAFEDSHNISVPEIYVSTSISSGGHYFNPDCRDGDGRPDFSAIIPANNRAAALIAGAVETTNGDIFNAGNIMLPNELGPVYLDKATNARWKDSHYMNFYLTWLSGLSASGTHWAIDQLRRPPYAEFIATMDNRTLSHDERWPAYQAYIEVMCSKINVAGRRPGGRRGEPSHTLLQLIDTEHSLGCRAETLYAEIRGMHIIAPLFDLTAPSLSEEARTEAQLLRSFETHEGTPSVNVGCPVELELPLVAVSLP